MDYLQGPEFKARFNEKSCKINQSKEIKVFYEESADIDNNNKRV